ncbi:MAG: hypothetical protein JRJ85_21220, partial [Deltaproteobacteria bacterium]|nr:hypothetical protein [Deltaproteobacteria bacterium]
MDTFQFPFILSPCLGCPEIIALDENRNIITVIVAANDEWSCKWSLVPSLSNMDTMLKEIPLHEEGREEIPWGFKSFPSSIDKTRENISKELYLDALGGNARIYKVSILVPNYGSSELLKTTNGRFRPTLYDLFLEGASFQKKPHAVCLTESKNSGLRFIHLADLHLARRNDFIEQEVSTHIEPVKKFCNFNDNLRKFIKEANHLAAEGELDMVLIGGDLIDFVNHGISNITSSADNNWQIF